MSLGSSPATSRAISAASPASTITSSARMVWRSAERTAIASRSGLVNCPMITETIGSAALTRDVRIR
jgi:hypothetical protein